MQCCLSCFQHFGQHPQSGFSIPALSLPQFSSVYSVSQSTQAMLCFSFKFKIALHSGSFKAQQVAQNCLYFLVSSSHLEVGNDSLHNLQLVKFCLITLTFLGGEVGTSSLESLFLLLFLATVFSTCTVICAGFSAFSGILGISLNACSLLLLRSLPSIALLD